MVFEQMLTIFFAAGVGVAIIAYSTRSRHRVTSGLATSTIAISSPADIVQEATPAPEVTAAASPVVEAPAEVQPVVEAAPAAETTAIVEVTPVTTTATAAGPSEPAPIATIDAAAVATAPVSEAVETQAPSAVGTSPAPKRRSAASRARARPSQRTRKR